MPTISFTISNGNATKLINAFCGLNNYQTTIPDPTSTPQNPKPNIPNPESKEAFTKRMVKQWMIQQTKRWEEKSLKDAIVVSDIEIQ